MAKGKIKKPSKKSKKSNKLAITSIVLAFILICTAAIFYYDYNRIKEYEITTIIDDTTTVTMTINTVRGLATTPIVDPVKEGYSFEGWYRDIALTQSVDITKDKIKGISNLYAKMLLIQFTETFESNGGSEVAPMVFNYFSSPIEPEVPILYNNLFTGWYLNEALTDRYAFNTIPNENIKLYGGWVAIQDALTYTNQFGYITITGFKADIPEHFIIPTTIDGIGVKRLENEAFKNCTKLIEVSIPTFNLEIGNSIFTGCNSLERLNYPLKELSYYSLSSFYGGANRIPASLKTIHINEGSIKVGTGAFYENISLETIVLPDTITIIDDGAFSGCSNLVNINMPASLVKIGTNVFSNCYKIKSIAIPSGVTYISIASFSNCTQLTDVSLPETLTRIEEAAFVNCTALVNINLPDNINLINTSAFFNCGSLVNVTLPANITEIKASTFGNCSKLETVSLPVGITKIGQGAFSNCTQLTSINFPDTLEYIDSYAFSFCSRLNNINFPSSLISIEYYAFGNCILLSNITFAEGLLSIKYGTFSNCTALKTINLPSSLTHLGSEAFSSCTMLESITFNSITPPTMESFAFQGVSNYLVIKVPEQSVNAYKTASMWSNYANKIQAIT